MTPCSTRLLSALLAILVALACAACGGGGPGTPVTVTLKGTPELEGDVSSSHGVVLTSVNPAAERTVGDLANPPAGIFRGVRVCLSFDLTPIPPRVRVLSATLSLRQSSVTGSPYSVLGSLVVDQVLFGGVLDGGAYDRSFPSNQAFATLSSNAVLEVKSVTATGPVQADIDDARLQSQFRLRFELEQNGDGISDQVHFPSSTSADGPTLIVTYQP